LSFCSALSDERSGLSFVWGHVCKRTLNYIGLYVPRRKHITFPIWAQEVNSSSSYITTDGQSASLSWCQAPLSDPRTIFIPFLIISRRFLA
jgi:hypothetical protein